MSEYIFWVIKEMGLEWPLKIMAGLVVINGLLALSLEKLKKPSRDRGELTAITKPLYPRYRVVDRSKSKRLKYRRKE